MPPGGYGADPDDSVVGDVLRHLAEIGAGRISITDADLANAPSDNNTSWLCARHRSNLLSWK